MRIEYLYTEIANLYGDNGNPMLIGRIFPEAEVVRTALEDRPAFVDKAVDLLYLGPSSERAQRLILEKLRPYAQALRELIRSGAHLLFTGNALELLGQSIEDEAGERVPGLGFYPYRAKQSFRRRMNCEYMGEALGAWAGEEPLLGFKTQFSLCHGAEEERALARNLRGFGMDEAAAFEGVTEGNFIGTYLVGPFLAMNPGFLRRWLKRMGEGERPIPFYADMQAAYARRLREFENPRTYLS